MLLLHLVGVFRISVSHFGEDKKLHLGCGANIKKGWVNIGLNPSKNIFSVDLRRKFPFNDDSCSAIYAEHLLEHFGYPDQALDFLNECYRVLIPGGVINIGVPDVELAIDAYLEGPNTKAFDICKGKYHPGWCETRMEHINFIFRNHGDHFFAYDFETLKKILAKGGFKLIVRRKFDPTIDSREGSLYVEAIK